MFKLRGILKSHEKKINFIFFINSEKTHHYKMSYNLFKGIISCVLSVFIFLFVGSVIGLFALLENRALTQDIVHFKSVYIQEYFDFHFKASGHTRLASTDSQNKQTKNMSAIQVFSPQNEEQNALPSSAEKKEPILVEKLKSFSRDDQFIISFSLMNAENKDNRPRMGSICAKVEGSTLNSQKEILSFPVGLVSDKQGLPTASCEKGERVKFNHLRPLEIPFLISPQMHFQATKVEVYFLENGSQQAVLLKEGLLP